MNNEITCPHCDYEFEDSESVFDDRAFDSIDVQCPNCNEIFECERITKYKITISKYVNAESHEHAFAMLKNAIKKGDAGINYACIIEDVNFDKERGVK